MTFTAPLALLVWAAMTPLTPAPTTPVADLNVYYETDLAGLKFTAQVDGAQGDLYAVLANIDGVAPIMLGYTRVGQDLVWTASSDVIEAIDFEVRFTAAYLDGGTVITTPPANMVLGMGVPCEELNFNHAIGTDAGMIAGNEIDDEWVEMGMMVSARNNRAGHPDMAILFDSSNPTGDDLDLLTPNPLGFNNTEAFDHVLIVAEDDIDVAPFDTYVDDPDDEAFGGSLYFDFDPEVGATICSTTLIDIDESPGTELRFYRNGDVLTPDVILPIVSLGDGSVQRVNFHEPGVTRFEVYFRGSGAIASVELIPCPRMINFNETTTGIPMPFQTGEEIREQYAPIGLHIYAENNNPSHPDKVILFDSENPTGGDFDLLTPNPLVPGNDIPLGYVLIIAENDVDVAPADGLVDDPDDEAGGGTIVFEFDYDVFFESARVLDVDATEVDHMRFYDRFDNEMLDILIPDLPDGNVQLLGVYMGGVRKVVFELGGSGAITRLRFCPEEPGCPDCPK